MSKLTKYLMEFEDMVDEVEKEINQEEEDDGLGLDMEIEPLSPQDSEEAIETAFQQMKSVRPSAIMIG